jgi:tetratricopeptide (TPR) repeat protein
MKKAVKLDPEFAMACRSLGSSYNNLDQSAESLKYYRMAFEFRDRVSERERFSIEGDFYRQSEKTTAKAIEAYQRLLQLYPDDMIGGTNLGVLYMNIEEWDKAIELYRGLVERGAGDVILVGNLAESYEATGRYEAAEELLKRYSLKIPDNDTIVRRLAWVYALESKSDPALLEIDKAISLKPQDYSYPSMKAGIFFLKGDLSAAKQEIQALMQRKNTAAELAAAEAMGKLYVYEGKFGKIKELAELGLERAKKAGDIGAAAKTLIILSTLDQFIYEDFDGALHQLDEANSLAVKSEDLNMQRSILLARGQIYIDKKSMAEAERVAAALKEMCDNAASKKQIRLYFELQARIELAKKDYSGALEHIRQMIALWSSPGPSDLLADAYALAGDKKQALEEYRKFIASPSVKINNIGTYVVSFYKLGRIAEDMGLKDEAIRYYERFLDIWKDADPGAPNVKDARKRLAGLKGNR